MPIRPYPSWQRRHEAVLLWLIQNPSRKLYECATDTGYSPSQVSRITRSREFQQRYRAARNWISEEVSRQSIEREPQRERAPIRSQAAWRRRRGRSRTVASRTDSREDGMRRTTNALLGKDDWLQLDELVVGQPKSVES